VQYVTDTHSRVWHMTGDPRLSVKAKSIFDKTDDGHNQVVVPCIVFFELVYLIEKNRLSLDFDGFSGMVSLSKNYMVEPLCLPIIQRSRTIPREMLPDPWDRLIAATSMHLQYPLISRDRSIRKLGVNVIW